MQGNRIMENRRTTPLTAPAPSEYWEFIAPITELFYLWKPVFPYLAFHVMDSVTKTGGHVLEAGPFCGMTPSLQAQGIGRSYSIAPFPASLSGLYENDAAKEGVTATIIPLSDGTLNSLPTNYADLLIVRGAFFFPSFFDVDPAVIFRILKPRGVAFAGGGFGKYTPDNMIETIRERSKTLNDMVGKVSIEPAELVERCARASLTEMYEVSREGGLWVIIRKE